MSGQAFARAKLGPLELRNRVFRAGCFEGMCQGGGVTDALIEHHRAVAAGGVAMTTVGYCAVSADGRGFGHEMWMHVVRDPEFVNRLARGEIAESDCDHCNRCIASMDAGGVTCVSREKGLLN